MSELPIARSPPRFPGLKEMAAWLTEVMRSECVACVCAGRGEESGGRRPHSNEVLCTGNGGLGK